MLDHLFYRGTQTVYSAPEKYGICYESVAFAAPSGERLHGWFFPAGGRARGTVVHCHGNAGNITGHFEQVRWLPTHGWNVLCFDYRGYGYSEGRTTRAGTVEDTHAAIDYVKSRPDVDGESIVLLGSSLGGAVATVAAARNGDVKGLVLDSAFSHYRREVEWVCRYRWYTRRLAPWIARLFFSDGLNAVEYIGEVAPRPILIIHGTADLIVDPAMARELYDAAREPKSLWLIDELDHTAAFRDRPDEAIPRVLDFLESCMIM